MAQSASAMGDAVTQATEHAKLIGFDERGRACVWYGGYGFNVYDARGDWSEIRHFTSGQLAGCTDYESEEAYEYAEARMRAEGFRIC